MGRRRPRDGRCGGRRRRPELADRDAHRAHEDGRPAEHGRERDRLEGGRVHDAEPEQGARDGEVAEDADRHAAHAPGQAVQQPGRRQQHPAEAGHHAVGDDVVHGLVDGQRDAAGQRQVRAEDEEADAGRVRGAAPRDVATEARQVDVQTRREPHDREPGERQRGVEDRARGVREHAETAEVEMPPHRIGGRQDGQSDPRQDDRHDGGAPVRGGHVGHPPRETPGGKDGRAHVGTLHPERKSRTAAARARITQIGLTRRPRAPRPAEAVGITIASRAAACRYSVVTFI
jgi:hypothetical protein